jgi:hypothetical protein
MSNQNSGAGHHAITRAAVREFFQHVNPPGGVIDGMNEDAYFHALDAAQENADRLLDVEVLPGGGDPPGVGPGVVVTPGPTTHPAWADGKAQREHGMADPNHTGAWNLETDKQFVEDRAMNAHTAAVRGDRAGEMEALGAAAHALEDSYSEAHAWRTNAANHGDPTAAVQSFNVFDPLPNIHGGHITGGKITGQELTHTDEFDNVPVETPLGNLIHGSDQAAAHATAGMLEAEYATRHPQGPPTAGGAAPGGLTDHDARAAVDQTVGQYYQAAAGGVGVNRAADSNFEHERDRRLEEHHQEDAAWRAAHPNDSTSKDLSPDPDAAVPDIDYIGP